jgi:hypothetical protein
MRFKTEAEVSGSINTTNLVTMVSLAILVGTEIIGVALAAGWAIAGLFQLGTTVSYGLMALFSALGLLALTRFMRRAIEIEPLRN